jgi:ParB family chromosome partitioning protein
LDALLPPKASSSAPLPQETKYAAGNVFNCALEKIVPQRGQPRQVFDAEPLDELARSIREHGLIEPLVVRRSGDDRFEIIAGERRWRAAQRAGLREVLVVVREVSSKDAFELALIENIQREDLNPLEFAEALQRLLSEHDYTQETLAQRVGKERSTITNALRLLKLPEKIRRLVLSAELSEGHARALLGAPDEATMERLAEKCIRGRLSVRQLEAEVRALRNGGTEPRKSSQKSAGTRDLEARISRHFGARCEVRDRDGKGEIVLRYGSLDELDRIIELML